MQVEHNGTASTKKNVYENSFQVHEKAHALKYHNDDFDAFAGLETV